MSRTLMLFFVVMPFLCKSQTSGQNEKTELIIIGTVHFPTKNVNADSIYNILNNLKPDIILLESDMSNFNADFTFKRYYDENEWNAVIKYQNKLPEIIIRPFDFEGRNNYRVKNGIQNVSNVFKRIKRLYSRNKLNEEHKIIWEKYSLLSNSLDAIGKKPLKKINTAETDSIVEKRQYYQYIKLKEVTDSNKRLHDVIYNKIKLSEQYSKYSFFEQLRNKTMVDNILNWINQYPGKKIIVLTGFFHRYFLIKELKRQEMNFNFIVNEFYN